MTKYSFIIPHHNTPELLLRCLRSIPQREDIEIIVVDDNSDENKKPQIERFDVKLVNIDAEHTKGAGRARNYGIKEAQGKWLLFADADDYYHEGFLEKIDKAIKENTEVLYFNIYSDVEGANNRASHCNTIFSNYFIGRATEEDVKFLVWGPWNKVISRNFIYNHNLQYEEIPSGNDAFFSFYVAKNVRNYKIIQDRLYCITNNPNSITYKVRSINEEIRALELNIRIHVFIENNTSCKLKMPVFYSQNVKNVYKQGGWSSVLAYVKYICKEYSLGKAFLQILRYKTL